MAIADVKRFDNGIVEIYDENAARTGLMTLGADSQITGFTATSIAVQMGPYTYTYDASGQQTGMR